MQIYTGELARVTAIFYILIEVVVTWIGNEFYDS